MAWGLPTLPSNTPFNQNMTSPTKRGRVRTAIAILPVIIVAYLAILLALIHTDLQRNLLYLHRIKLPLNANYDNPEIYGLAPYKTRNFKIGTHDGESLGAWHVLPQSVYRNISDVFPPLSPLPEQVFDDALKTRPTVLYLHGNAATRAVSHRVRTICDFSTILDCNVVAIDYRGFADSTGSPSEHGLLNDAQSAWDWIVSRSDAKEEGGNIAVIGHSLGTGVASKLVGALADRDVHPKTVVLIAPFSSIPELLLTYRIGGIPLLSPLKWIPHFQQWLLRWMKDSWWSSRSIIKCESPLLIVHAQDDLDIPATHSAVLFEEVRAATQRRVGNARALAVEVEKRPGWGQATSFRRDRGEVIWFEGEYGGHNHVAGGEGVVDLIDRIMHGQ